MTRSVLFLALFFAPAAQAATLSVPSQYATIQAAVDAAVSGDVIDIAPGTYTEDVLVLTKDLALNGAGPGLTTLRAASTTPFFATTSEVELSDLTIDGQGVTQGAVFSVGSAIIDNVEFLDTFDTDSGASLELAGLTSATITDSRFVDATSSIHGSHLYALNVTDLLVTRNTFCGGFANGDGDALFASGTSGQVLNNAFVQSFGSSAVHFDNGDWDVQANLFLDSAGTGLVHSGADDLDLTHNAFDASGNWHVSAAGTTLNELYNAYGSAGFGDLLGSSPDATSFTGLSPDFRGYPTHDCRIDDFLPVLDSPLLDVDTTDNDLDASDRDIGISSGDQAPPHWFESADGDPAHLVYDCDDDDPDNFPSNTEQCALPGDNDCDGLADDNDPSVIDQVYFGRDSDQDGFGSPANGDFVVACDNPDPLLFVENTLDCDDTNPLRNPDADELCGDGLDNDCDLAIDDETSVDAVDWWTDADNDGYGPLGETPVRACDPPFPDAADQYGDCAPLDPYIHPDAIEVCDGIDNDCTIDEYDAVDAPTWVPDVDGDGFAAEGAVGQIVVCDAPGPDYIDLQDSLGDDCDDANPDVYPGAPEVCDGFDNDCNTVYDDLPGTPTTVYDDIDGDGYGASNTEQTTHCPLPYHVEVGGDCDDDDDARYPGAVELCDGIDNDCSGSADDGPSTTWFEDFDGDGYGKSDDPVTSQCAPAGRVDVDGDCADGNDAIHPGADEVPGNDVDEDCDGVAQGASEGPTDGVEARKGCQCSTGGAALGGWMPALLLLLGWRRRR